MTRKRLTVAGIVGCALMGGSVLATSALWRQSISLDGGDVRAGSVVLLNGSATSQVKTYAFTPLAGATLKPGSSVQAPLVIRNGGTAPLAYRLVQTTSSGSAVLPGQLLLRLDVVPSSCVTGVGQAPATGVTANLYNGVLPGASTAPPRPLAVGATETLCVRVSVASGAPKSASGAATTTTFTFGAEIP